MKYLKNMREIDMTLWEVEILLRKENPEVCAVVTEGTIVEIGDVIVSKLLDDKASCWEVLEIIEERPASLGGKTFLRMNTKWTSRSSLPIINYFSR